MKTKTVAQTFPAMEVDMGGMPILQPFPTNRVEQIDPFLLLHHGHFKTEAGTNPLHSGVGPHPHRGFMPVTYVIDGELHRRDSLGNSSVIGKGGAQWLNAGRGIVHSERPSARTAEKGGTVEVIQLWVNLPKEAKMAPAGYQGIKREEMPVVAIAEGMSLELIAGDYAGQVGKAKTPFPVFMAALKSTARSEGFLALPEGMNGGMYLIKGDGKIAGHGTAEEKNFYRLSAEGEGIKVELSAGSLALIIMGKPLEEPLATYGPFVMNNQTQIMEALRDYNQGKMGVLIEER